MGFRTVAIGRGGDKEKLAKDLGAHVSRAKFWTPFRFVKRLASSELFDETSDFFCLGLVARTRRQITQLDRKEEEDKRRAYERMTRHISLRERSLIAVLDAWVGGVSWYRIASAPCSFRRAASAKHTTSLNDNQ
jgi:hypothetical protein